MKKTIAKIIFSVTVIVLLFGLVACNKNDYKGTYYEYVNGEKVENSFITLDKKSWKDDDGESGRLEVKDGVIYGYYEIFGEEDKLFEGTVSDGAFRFTFGDGYKTFYRDGAYKEGSGGGDGKPTEYNVTFDSCGGSDVAGKKATAGSTITAPEQPTRALFIFDGWFKDSAYAAAWDFAVDTVNENVTLYARWKTDEVRIISLDGTEINGTTLTMIVDDSINRVDLASKVVLNSAKATWKLYYDELGQMEIPTKLATGREGVLNSGSNVFYIVVTSEDGTQTKLYTLDVYKKYAVTVSVYGLSYELEPRQTYTVYTLETLTEPSDSITITGYAITGWTSTGAAVGETVPKDSPRNITLRANATPNEYTVTLDPDGGNLSSTEKVVTFDGRINFAVPTKMGHSFLGWFADDTQIADENGVCEKWTYASDKTLTAEWRANRYSVSVVANDNEAGTVSVESSATSVNLYFDGNGVEWDNLPEPQVITKTNGMTVPETPTADRYVFTGWIKENRGTNYFDFTEDISNDTTVYAGWYKYSDTENSSTRGAVTAFGEQNAQTITTQNSYQYRYFAALADGNYYLYYKNGSSSSSYATYLQIYDETERSTVRSNGTVSNTSYNYCAINAKKGHVYSIRVYRYSYSSDFTFYVTVSNPQQGGGKLGSGTVTAGEYGSTVKLTATTNSGYTFAGWFDGEDLISEEPIYEASVPAKNVTYTAKWCKVTLEKNIDEAGSISVLSGHYVIGEEVSVTATTNAGYTWLGWYDGEIKVSEDTDLTYTFTMTAESKTYTAKWAYYTVTTETNLNEAGSYIEYTDKKVAVGDSVTLTATTNVGYTWLGWYDGETKVSDSTDLTYTFTMPAESKAFTAKWIVCPVTLEKNIPEAGTVSGVEGATAVGAETTIMATTNAGYTWLGWYDGETKVSKDAQLTYMFTMTAANKTYTAKFEKCTAHTLNDDCVCTKCGQIVHQYMDTKGYCRHGEYIYFGYYPQTIKADGVAVGDNADSDGYYLGSDGERYAKVTATPYSRGYKFSNNTTVDSGTIYYFKVEPIKWRVLEEKNNNAFIFCESIIENKAYQLNYEYSNREYYTNANGAPSGTYANNYMYSSIRQWLNNEFYNKAFKSMQQELIQITNVDNSVASTGHSSNSYACENTNDKVFLLSYKEVTNSAYGFSSDDKNYDTARIKQTSDYSRATGVCTYDDDYDNGIWCLRSPSIYGGSNTVRDIHNVGYAGNYGFVSDTYYGIVPALWIKLS